MTARLIALGWAGACLTLSYAAIGEEAAIQIRLESEPLPKAISLDDDHAEIVGFRIEATLDAKGGGSGQLGLDRSKYEFDRFGDASLQGEAKIEQLPISLETIAEENGSRTVDLTFEGDALSRRLALVLSDGTEPHRLVVRHPEARYYDREHLSPQLFFELKGEPAIESPIPPLPLRLPASFEALSSFGHERRPGLHKLEIRLTDEANGTIAFDPNGLGYDAFARVEMTTLIGYGSLRFKATSREEEDRAGRRCKTLTLEPSDYVPAGDYSLVLGQTDEGPHRLVVAVDGKAEEIIPLYLPDRRRHAREQAALEKAPEAERKTLDELRRRIGYEFEFRVEGDHVVSLEVVARGSTKQVDDLLSNLSHLRGLSFRGMELDADGLTSLAKLERLTGLGGDSCRVDEGAFARVGDCKDLKSLSFMSCDGITDAEMRHLEPLLDLEYLRISNDVDPGPNSRDVGRVTDAGVAALAGMQELKRLNLQGQPITDKGLVTIGRLEALEDLAVSGEGVTDNGVLQFKPTSKLKRVNLYGTSVSEVGQRRLQRTLPNLEDWP